MDLAALAEPPDHFRAPLPTVVETSPWYRIHECVRDAVYFNRSAQYRFNAPDAEFGVLYAAESVDAAFLETLMRFGKRPPVVLLSALGARTVSQLRWERPLLLVDFTGTGLVQLGLDARILSMGEYGLCQRWARWLYAHPTRVDGLLYRSRMAPHRRSIALFERAGVPSDSVVLVPSLASTAFSAELGEILESVAGELL